MANENNNVASFNVINTPSMVAGTNIPSVAIATFASGATLSSTLSLGGSVLIGLISAVTWTAADLTMQASVDNTNFFDVYDKYGAEMVLKTGGTAFTTSSKFIPLAPADYIPYTFLRFRSGTAATPVTQAAGRTITAIIRTV